MRYLCVGVGAIGGTVAAHLAAAGEQVEVVDVDHDHIEAIKAHGLTIDAPGHSFTAAMGALHWNELSGPVETVLLAVKSQATEAAVRSLMPYLDERSVIVSVQNGLNEDVIAGLVGRDRTMGAFINFSAEYVEPGRVAYYGPGPFYLGELDGAGTRRLETIATALGKFTPITVSDNIFGYLWTKLGYGTMVTASGVVDMDQADVFELFRDVMIELGSETWEVALREQVSLPSVNGISPLRYVPRRARDVTALNQSFDEMVDYMRKHQKPRSGVWRDLKIRGRRTEVDFQAGAAVRIGLRHAMKLPLTERLIEIVHEIEDGRRELATANLDELDSLRKSTPTVV